MWNIASDDDMSSEEGGLSIPPPAAPMKPQRHRNVQLASQKAPAIRQRGM